ncbi:uncharacterized protein LOC144636662 isoform X2 [Oculina patagonica]
MGVNGGPGVWRRVREACTNRKWPWTRSSFSKDGSGTVVFASTDEVLKFVYRPNLSVRDVCTEAALKVNISPVGLDFFTLVSEDGSCILNPNKVLSEVDCSQVYAFKLCIKACHGLELRDFDKIAFAYYFHQCRQDFLSGKIGEFSENNQNHLAQLVLFETIYLARKRNVPPKDVINNPGRHGIRKLFQRGIFAEYSLDETKSFLNENLEKHENIKDDQIKSQYISSLERAEDFFVHKFSFEKVYGQVSRKFQVLISAEFGIKKKRTDVENSLPEIIVEKFSDVEALEFDRMRNIVTIFRKEFKPETLTASSTQEADSLITLIEGYYRLMVNQYKQLLRGSKSTGSILCHGPISRKLGEYLLLKRCKEDGSFLLRKKRSEHFNLVLSVYVGEKVMNYDIVWDTSTEPGFYHLKGSKKGFSDLLGLVEHHKLAADGLLVCLKQILRPKTEGLAALLDRQVLAPAVPEVHLVDAANQIDNLILEPGNSLSTLGEFGEVKKGSWTCATADNELVYVVSRALVKPIGREKIKNFKEAMRTFLELQNPYLTLFYGIVQTEKALIFVFEFAAEGPLDQYIKTESKKEGGISKGRVISYAAQIAEGMMFLHSKNCVHGRLNAHNVVVAHEECVKISDFGLLHLVKNGQSFFHAARRGHGYCWFSPQSLLDHTFNVESDIWSFGVTLWEMLAMKRPFHCSLTEQVLTEKEVMSRYLKGQYLNPDRPNCPANVGNLIKRCCAPEPKDRMSFRELVTELRSPDLVPDDKAQDLLLPPEITQLEDWEASLPTHQNQIELQSLPSDSQVSNVDYSCLPGNEVHEIPPNDEHNRTLPGISVITSISPFDNTTSRTRSLSKTFSHPGLVHAFEAEGTPPATEAFRLLAARKPSITRVSSCPPAIQAGNEGSQPTERQQDERYVPCPSADVKMPRSSLPSKQVSHVYSAERPATVNSEEVVDSDSGSNDDSSTEDGGAEAMAMRSLAKHFPTSIHQSSVVSVPPVAETQPQILSASFVADMCHHDEDDSEQLSECGSSSSYIKLDLPRTEVQPEKPRAGSYVKLSTAVQGSMPQDQARGSNTLQSSVAVHSTVNDSPDPASSPAGNAVGTKRSSSEPCSQNTKHKATQHTEMSPYQEHPKIKETSPKSPDELLGSFSSGSIQNEMGSVSLADLLPDFKDDGSFDEGSSPLITDLQDESEADYTDFRGVAESSLGEFFFQSNVGLELDEISEQPSALEEKHSHCNSQPHTNMELDSPKVSTGYISNQELHERSRQENSTLSEDGQMSLAQFSDPTSNIGLELSKMSEQPSFVLEEQNNPCNLQPHADKELNSAKMSTGYVSNQELYEHNRQEDSTEDSQLSLGKLSHPKSNVSLDLNQMPEKSFPVLEEEHSHYSSQPRANMELDSAKSGYISTEELHENNGQEDSTLPEDRNEVNRSPDLDPFEFCRNTSTNLNPSVLEDICSLLPELMNNTANGEESDEENDDDDDDDAAVTSDTELSSSCGPVGYSHEINESTAGTSDSNYIDKEAQLVRKEDDHIGRESFPEQANDKHPEEEEQEPVASLSRSSSSDGIWPTSDKNKGYHHQRTSTIDSCSSSGNNPKTLDMSDIPLKLQIPFEQLELQGFLGQGNFGEVRKATIVSTECWSNPKKEEVAVKLLKKTATDKDSSDFNKEVQNMIELESKQRCMYIIKLRGVSKDPLSGKLMLVTELAPLGSLRTYLPKNKDILRAPQLLDFCMQICKGMRYLENQSLLHKDLAARNILVMREDLVKISDFGLSRLQDYYKIQESSKVPVKWYALESLLKQRFTTKSDVWSFGVTMWEIFTYGGSPYGNMESQELPEFLEKGNRLSCPETCPQKVYDVMYSCWLKDATKRPSFHLLETTDLAKLKQDFPIPNS